MSTPSTAPPDDYDIDADTLYSIDDAPPHALLSSAQFEIPNVSNIVPQQYRKNAVELLMNPRALAIVADPSSGRRRFLLVLRVHRPHGAAFADINIHLAPSTSASSSQLTILKLGGFLQPRGELLSAILGFFRTEIDLDDDIPQDGGTAFVIGAQGNDITITELIVQYKRNNETEWSPTEVVDVGSFFDRARFMVVDSITKNIDIPEPRRTSTPQPPNKTGDTNKDCFNYCDFDKLNFSVRISRRSPDDDESVGEMPAEGASISECANTVDALFATGMVPRYANIVHAYPLAGFLAGASGKL